MKKTVIWIIVAVLSLLIIVGGFISYLYFFYNYTFLGNPVTEEAYNDLENFIQQSVNDFYADKKVVLVSGELSAQIPAVELQSVNIEKTIEYLNAIKNESPFMKLTDNTVFPVINLNDDTIKNFIFSFVKDNNIADFYNVSEDFNTVDINLNKKVPDIQNTYYEIARKLNYTDFSDVDLLFTDKVNALECYELICQPAVNAEIDYESENKDIIPEKDGYKVNYEQLEERINNGEKIFTLDIEEIIKPEITASYLEDKYCLVMFWQLLLHVIMQVLWAGLKILL